MASTAAAAASKAQVTTLFRRLLLKVHPDVVASQSDRFRAHNEATLKVLMGCLEDTEAAAAAAAAPRQHVAPHAKIHFYLRDGGKTPTVAFSRSNAMNGLQVLLGEAAPTPPPATAANRAKSSSSTGKTSSSSSSANDELRRAWEHSLNHWWNNRVRSVDNMELLFQQHRVRFVLDFLDPKLAVSSSQQHDEHRFALESALDMVRTAFDLHVADSTLDALVQAPELQNIEIRIVAKNLYKPEVVVRRNGVNGVNGGTPRRLLCVPLGCPADVLGEELDKLVDAVLRQVLLKEEEEEANQKKRQDKS